MRDKIIPDTLFIGPMRTATTWIHEYLSARNDVCLPKGVKETFFFDRHFDQGLSWYKAHFRHYNPKRHKRVVEVAPSYFHSPEAPERIAESLGQPRLVVVVRDPVERSISHYRHIRRRGLTKASLLKAIKSFPEIVKASQYAALLDRWEEIFGAGSVRLLFQKELAVSPSDFVRSLCRTIDLPYKEPSSGLVTARVNSAGDPPFFWLARAGKMVADFLRAHQLYGLINLAKTLGLKRVFFGADRPQRKSVVSEEERQVLYAMLADDWKEMQQRFKQARHNNL